MGLPDYLKDETSRKKGNKAEKVVRSTINSGAFWVDKLDLEVDKLYKVEVKSRWYRKGQRAKSYTITEKLLTSILAKAGDKIPVLEVVLPNYICHITFERRRV